jgi:hypothetical protein
MRAASLLDRGPSARARICTRRQREHVFVLVLGDTSDITRKVSTFHVEVGGVPVIKGACQSHRRSERGVNADGCPTVPEDDSAKIAIGAHRVSELKRDGVGGCERPLHFEPFE